MGWTQFNVLTVGSRFTSADTFVNQAPEFINSTVLNLPFVPAEQDTIAYNYFNQKHYIQLATFEPYDWQLITTTYAFSYPIDGFISTYPHLDLRTNIFYTYTGLPKAGSMTIYDASGYTYYYNSSIIYRKINNIWYQYIANPATTPPLNPIDGDAYYSGGILYIYSEAFITPIIDRTIADIKAKNNKAYINFTDINRIETNMEYLKNQLNVLYYKVDISIKTDWDNTDIPTYEEVSRIISNMQSLLNSFYTHPDAPNVPTTIKSYTDANNLEANIYYMNQLLVALKNSFIYSGTFNSGQTILYGG